MKPAFYSLLMATSVLAEDSRGGFAERIAALEKLHGGRLGISVLDTSTGRRLEYRASERFAMCSTFKALLVGAVLALVDTGGESLERWVPYGRADLLEYAPIAKAHLGEGGMRVGALCSAAVEYSDNTAANLLLARVGGPPGLTTYLRGLGDTVTRLDRDEPTLNTDIPGDPRDTTTPAAMVGLLERILLGNALSSTSRARLFAWMERVNTGRDRLRAGLPSTWRVGDKTGTCGPGTLNDLAIAWPPGRAPVLIAVYSTHLNGGIEAGSAALAEVARVVVSAFG